MTKTIKDYLSTPGLVRSCASEGRKHSLTNRLQDMININFKFCVRITGDRGARTHVDRQEWRQ